MVNIVICSNIADCPKLSNITIDASTFAALDALPDAGNADVTDKYMGFDVNQTVSTSASDCSAIGGTIQRLWKTKLTKYTVDVCVVEAKTTVPPTTQDPVSPSTSSTSFSYLDRPY